MVSAASRAFASRVSRARVRHGVGALDVGDLGLGHPGPARELTLRQAQCGAPVVHGLAQVPCGIEFSAQRGFLGALGHLSPAGELHAEWHSSSSMLRLYVFVRTLPK